VKILLLDAGSPHSQRLRANLTSGGHDVFLSAARITGADIADQAPDILVCYGYRFILPPEVFTIPRLGAINLHISYLPWNRGADPNFWSHVEDTAKGVSFHYIDAGIDTGDIIARERVAFSHGETLRSSYEILHERLVRLFSAWWPLVCEGSAPRIRQETGGTFHLKRDRAEFEYLLAARGWDTPVQELATLHLDHEKIHRRR
jgi:methionyl-tRNA formyltransferase